MSKSDKSKIIDALQLFNEKAEKLNRLSFIETVLNHNTGVTLSCKKQEDGFWEMQQLRKGPDEEAIDAFVLTIRFFIQDNEKSSFRNLASVYSNSLIDLKFRKEFDKIRNAINKFLDGNSGMGLNFLGEELNYRKIMELLIYGALSHANVEKKKTYDMISQTPMKALVDDKFVTTLTMLHRAINDIKNLNKKVIKQIKNLSL